MKFIFAAYAFCIATVCYSQNNRELKIGERIPDVKIDKVFSGDLQLMSSYQGKKSLKEFKGKLIILDFWHTGCSVCIEAFPKMSKLQEKYKDQIQIFLVNPYESYERFMGNWSAKVKDTSKLKNHVNKFVIPSNLPVLIDAVQLGRLFPGRGGVPYHVWIDQSGFILLRGIAENTYEEKIEDALAGKKISFVEDNFRAYDPRSLPFYSVQDLSGQKQISYSSSFGNFTENADPYGIGGNVIDSVNRYYRRTFINQSILRLYLDAFKNRFSKDTNVLHGSRVIITSSKKKFVAQDDKVYWNAQNDKITDEDFRSSSFGYEQILSIAIPDTLADRFMGEDLNRYFGLSHHIRGEIEQIEMDCYSIGLSKHQNIQESSSFGMSSKTSEVKDSSERRLREFKGGTVNESLQNYFMGRPDFIKETDLFVNSTNFNRRIDLLLPYSSSIKSLQELQQIFEQQGLTITKQRMKVNMLVIKDI